MANSLDSADNDYLDSKVYKWSEVGGGGGSFVEVQSIPTIRAMDLEAFTIYGGQYLAVSNYLSTVESKIYSWDNQLFCRAAGHPGLCSSPVGGVFYRWSPVLGSGHFRC